MWLDPEVARRKFNAEIESVQNQSSVLARRGCYIVRVVAPQVDAVFLPQQPLVIRPLAFLNIAGRAFGVRLNLEGFDVLPPSLTFCNPLTWEPLAFQELPLGMLDDGDGKPQPVLNQAHHLTGLPFLCVKGNREYHSHLEHDNEDWFKIRGAFGLFDLLIKVADLMCSWNPVVGFQVVAPAKWVKAQIQVQNGPA